MRNQSLKKNAIYLILLASLLWITHHYLLILTWSAIFAIILHPLYQILAKKLGEKSSALLLTSALLAVILLPLAFFLIVGSLQANDFFQHYAIKSSLLDLKNHLGNLPIIGSKLKPELDKINASSLISKFFNAESFSKILPLLKNTGSFLGGFFISFFLLAIFVFQFLLHAPKITAIIKNKILDSFTQQDKWLHVITASTRAISSNILITSLTTSLVMTSVYIACGLTAPVLLGALTGLIAIVPFMLPIFYALLTLLLVFNQSIIIVIVIVVIGLSLNFLMDNIVQPKLIKQKTQLNFSASLLGTLGGIQVLGPLGIFLGPILFNLVIKLFQLERDK